MRKILGKLPFFRRNRKIDTFLFGDTIGISGHGWTTSGHLWDIGVSRKTRKVGIYLYGKDGWNFVPFGMREAISLCESKRMDWFFYANDHHRVLHLRMTLTEIVHTPLQSDEHIT